MGTNTGLGGKLKCERAYILDGEKAGRCIDVPVCPLGCEHAWMARYRWQVDLASGMLANPSNIWRMEDAYHFATAQPRAWVLVKLVHPRAHPSMLCGGTALCPLSNETLLG